LAKTIKHFFPDLTEQLGTLTDTRQLAQYSIEEIVFAAIAMFIFKCGSRNSFDNLAKSENFSKNYFDLSVGVFKVVTGIFQYRQ